MDNESDDDRIFDGTEISITLSTKHPLTDVSQGNFMPDSDPSTTTSMVNTDSDGDGPSSPRHVDYRTDSDGLE